MPEHVVKRGLDIPIKGGATGTPVNLDLPSTIAYSPTEFRGVTPRLAVREGETVKAGQSLFFDKTHPEMVFRSPVAGKVTEVRRGKRRVITDIVVELDGEGAEVLPTHTLQALKGISRDDALKALLGSGFWGALRTRPLDRVPSPDVVPQSIVIAASDSGPLMPSAAELLADDDADAMQAAVYVLKALTDGKVFVTEHGAGGHKAVQGLEGAEHHVFKGPHPSGDPSVHVNLLDPPRGANKVWYLRAWDAALLGRFLLEGRFVAERTYAVVGAGCVQPRLVKTVLGAPLAHIAGEVADGPMRWIRGSVLTGEAVESDRWATFGSRALHLLPDVVPQSLFGWAMPSLGNWSFHRAFLTGFTGGGGAYDLRPGLFGGERAMVPIGVYGSVVATPDILPEFLFKSIVAGDLAESMALGLLDITQEEAALCSFICPSKIEFVNLLKDGLALYESEA